MHFLDYARRQSVGGLPSARVVSVGPSWAVYDVVVGWPRVGASRLSVVFPSLPCFSHHVSATFRYDCDFPVWARDFESTRREG